jgi:hypothetical protein
MRPDVRDFVMWTVCKETWPWIKPTTKPKVNLRTDGTVDLSWVYFDRTLRLHFPCQHVVILEKSDKEQGGNTVFRIKLDQSSIDEQDELRASFNWLRGDA